MKKQWKAGFGLGAVVLLAAGLQVTAYAAGWKQEEGIWRYYTSSGEPVTDTWKKSGDQWFYLDENGDMATHRMVEHDDNYYYVSSNGVRAANQWRQLPNPDMDEEDSSEYAWYYFQNSGKAYKAPESGKTTFKQITGGDGITRKYAFDSQGRMLYGWVDEESARLTGEDAWREGVYYCGEENDGARVENDWRKLEAEDEDNDSDYFDDSYWFYFSQNGRKMKDGKKSVNGRQYLFSEEGAVRSHWNENGISEGTPANAEYAYYNNEDRCWLAKGWFKTVPPEEVDPDSYDSGEAYWFYGLSDGSVVTSQIKSIDDRRYGFNEYGEMLYGLYLMEVEGNEILSCERIETFDQIPDKAAAENVYYFGDKPIKGAMARGRISLELDGERRYFSFYSSGEHRGAGVTGIQDGYIYEKGLCLTAEDGTRVDIQEYDGKEYLIDENGRIQKNKKNVKDADGYYYCTDKDGIVTYQGSEKQ